MLHVYVPTRDNIKKEVIDSINKQSIPCEIESVLCNYDLLIEHRLRVIKAKEECKKRALLSGKEFIVFHDNDFVDLYEDNFEKMHNYLHLNKDYGAVALARMQRVIPEHICCTVMMLRREFLSCIDFSLPISDVECFSIMESAKCNNFKYDYVDDIVRIKEIDYGNILR